jgi:hypothetical protein
MLMVLCFETSCPHTADPGSCKPRSNHTALLSKRAWKEELEFSSSVVQRTTIFRAASIQTLMSLGADASTTSHSRLFPCFQRARTRSMHPADSYYPQNNQVRAYTSTNITQARPPPGDQSAEATRR